MEIDGAKDDGAKDYDDDGAEDNNDDGEDDDDDEYGKIPEEAALKCLCDADLLQRAFNIYGPSFEYIVVCEEYAGIRVPPQVVGGRDRRLHSDGSSRHRFVRLQPTLTSHLTIHSGLGKMVFLLYLLLYRLQLELPTAVQFSDDEYIVFSAGGVSVCATDNSTDHWSKLPKGCWCLTDGNPDVGHPCKPFNRNDLWTFLITSPRLDRFKKWRTAVGADTVITALP